MLSGSVAMRNGFGRQPSERLDSNHINRRKEKNDVVNEHRQLRAKIMKQMIEFQTQLKELLGYGDDITGVMKGYYENCKDITPAHYAALIIGSRSYISVWVNCIIKDIIPTLCKGEQDFFIMKTLVSLKDYMDEKEIKKMIKVLVKDIDPKTAILIRYYFPTYITEKENKVISDYLNTKEDEFTEVIEKIVTLFEKRNAVFFRHLHQLLIPN